MAKQEYTKVLVKSYQIDFLKAVSKFRHWLILMGEFLTGLLLHQVLDLMIKMEKSSNKDCFAKQRIKLSPADWLNVLGCEPSKLI